MVADNPNLVEKKSSSSFRDAFLLFACGAAVLFWELLFIRWMGSCIRIIAYFSNFILVASFLGLGVGALISRKGKDIERFLIPAICFCLLLAPFLGIFSHDNPGNSLEYFWVTEGSAFNSVAMGNIFGHLNNFFSNISAPYWLLLGVSFMAVVIVFLILGQMLGKLFREFTPLKAYSLEIAGSLIGIGLFSVISFNAFPPTIWIFVGFVILLSIIKLERKTFLASIMFCSVTLYICGDFEEFSIWSPYYKIQVAELTKQDPRTGVFSRAKEYGYRLHVNNDYHQLILNLTERKEENVFFKSWRALYDYPHRSSLTSVEGPILIVGAGTGNDVSAAIRNTNAQIDIVEIDMEILRLGQTLHHEKPYSNSRVNIINDDARHYFAITEKKYAKIIFGFLDSHTLLSSFSSVRLDNFVYTQESLQRVGEILLPRGEVYITFATTNDWIHERIIRLLDSTFDQSTYSVMEKQFGQTNGIVYMNRKSADKRTNHYQEESGITVPTDNWPFLYLQKPSIPIHYVYFMVITVLLSVASLRLLPAGKRQVEFKYFFMGAGFFLIETSNIVKLSILHGSTWLVNVTVFSGILILILIGNWVSSWMKEDRFSTLFSLLLISCILSYVLEPKIFLVMNEAFTRGGLAGLIYLSPIFFASVIFARLIRLEENFYAVYGSNLLGAMVGGASEYFSLLAGFQLLVLISMSYYLLAWIFVARDSAIGQR